MQMELPITTDNGTQTCQSKRRLVCCLHKERIYQVPHEIVWMVSWVVLAMQMIPFASQPLMVKSWNILW